MTSNRRPNEVIPDHCQCPHKAVNHGPNGCSRLPQYRVMREKRTIYLCGDCTLPGDDYDYDTDRIS